MTTSGDSGSSLKVLVDEDNNSESDNPEDYEIIAIHSHKFPNITKILETQTDDKVVNLVKALEYIRRDEEATRNTEEYLGEGIVTKMLSALTNYLLTIQIPYTAAGSIAIGKLWEFIEENNPLQKVIGGFNGLWTEGVREWVAEEPSRQDFMSRVGFVPINAKADPEQAALYFDVTIRGNITVDQNMPISWLTLDRARSMLTIPKDKGLIVVEDTNLKKGELIVEGPFKTGNFSIYPQGNLGGSGQVHIFKSTDSNKLWNLGGKFWVGFGSESLYSFTINGDYYHGENARMIFGGISGDKAALVVNGAIELKGDADFWAPLNDERLQIFVNSIEQSLNSPIELIEAENVKGQFNKLQFSQPINGYNTILNQYYRIEPTYERDLVTITFRKVEAKEGPQHVLIKEETVVQTLTEQIKSLPNAAAS